MGNYNALSQDMMRNTTGNFQFGGYGQAPFSYAAAYHNPRGGGQYGYSGMGHNAALQQGGGFRPGQFMTSQPMGGWGGWGGFGGFSSYPMMPQNQYFGGGFGMSRSGMYRPWV